VQVGAFRSVHGRFVAANQPLADMLGYATAQDLIAAVHDIAQEIYVDPSRRAGVVRELQEAGGVLKGVENEYRCTDGETFVGRMNLWMGRDPETGDEYIEGLVEDITVLRKAQEEVRRSEETLRALVTSAQDIIVMQDRTGRYTYYNGPGEAGLEPGGVVGWTPHDVHPPEVADVLMDNVRRVVETKQACSAEIQMRGGTEPAWMSHHFYPIVDEQGQMVSVGTIARDVTDKKRAEQERERLAEELRHAQKMEATGIMAGGIAHDFNNIMTGIQGYAELLVDSLAPDDERRQDLDEILQATKHGATLTQQLLAFSRRQVIRPSTLDLCELVSHAKAMIERVLREDIEVRLDAPSDPVLVHVDRPQFEQVLINLANNAGEAMSGKGTLSFTVSRTEVPDGPGSSPPDLAPGNYALLSVADTGQGMPPEVVEQAFDPFFTTKGRATHSGLGLSMVYGAVQQHEGFIEVGSRSGQGSEFRIYLPLAEPESITSTSKAPCVRRDRPVRVLVVEDEDMVRSLIRKLLQREGYEVAVARNGEEALARWRQSTARFDLLVTDVIMPGLDGVALASEVRARWPDTRVLYISGHPEDLLHQAGVDEAKTPLVRKPFRGRSLLAKVEDLLR